MFILDSRSERSNNDYISKEQMDWLKVELSNSPANFKLILSSVPVTDMGDLVGEFYAKDRWQGYPTQRQEILEHIDNNKISGIYWLAGDLHFGMMSHLSPEGEPGANNWEIIVGPVGSPVLPLVSSNLIEPGDQYPHLIAKWNYVLFEADPITHNLEVQYIGNEGNVLFRKTLLSKGNQTDTEQ